MNRSEKNRIKLSAAVNGFIFLVTLIIVVIGIVCGAGDGQVGSDVIGFGYFKPFTIDSNILAGTASLVLVIYGIISLRRGENAVPRWAVTLHYAAAVSLGLTFLTVVLFLGPMFVLQGKSYWIMFGNELIFFHLIDPLLCFFSFIFLQPGPVYRRRDCLWTLLPPALYAAVYFLMVVVFAQWEDFYGFSFGGHYALVPLVVIVLFSLTALLALLLLRLRKAAGKRG